MKSLARYLTILIPRSASSAGTRRTSL